MKPQNLLLQSQKSAAQQLRKNSLKLHHGCETLGRQTGCHELGHGTAREDDPRRYLKARDDRAGIGEVGKEASV